MKMQIDFYSKDELAIQLDFSGRNSFSETDASELFLLACFVLRQLSNLGQHLVAKALAGLLVSSYVKNLAQENAALPSGNQILNSLRFHVNYVVGQARGVEEGIKAVFALESQLNFNSSLIQTLNNEFLAKMPRFVNYNGKGKKSFEVTLPPFSLDAKGFGFLGLEVNYYAFHSVIGLIRYLEKKHDGNELFMNQLVQIVRSCGSAYIFQQIPADQEALANSILNKNGIS